MQVNMVSAATCVLATCLMSIPAVAVAREPVILAPTTAWNLEWSPTTCTMRRGFGDKTKPDVLWIERVGPTEAFQLTLISNQFRNFADGNAVLLTLGNQAPHRLTNVSSGVTPDKTSTLFLGATTLDPVRMEQDDKDLLQHREHPDPALETSVDKITIKAAGKEVVLTTGSLKKPFEAMRSCTADLVRSWGLDPVAQADLARLPKPIASPATWIVPADYPAAMLVSGKQAIVNFRLTVDAQGSATACEIQRSFNDPTFDKATCRNLMRRARFEPARTKTGEAVPSYYLNTVRWITR